MVPFENVSTLLSTATGKYANCFALSISSSLLVPYSFRAVSTSSFVGLSLLATHGRPSIMITLSAPSCATSQVPTIGSNVAGGRPTVSLLRSTLTSAARRAAIARHHAPHRNPQCPHACLLNSKKAAARDQRRPQSIEDGRRTFWRDRERVSAELGGVAFDRHRQARELVDGFEHAFGRRHARDHLAAVELVPDFSVVLAVLLEESDRRRRDVLHLQLRHDAPKLRQRAVLEVRAPRILGRQVRLDVQRPVDLFQRRFVRFGERVGPAFGGVPAGGRERARDHRGRAHRKQAGGVERPPPDRDAQPDPDRRQRQSRQHQRGRDEDDIEANQAVLEFGDHRRRRVRGRALPDAAVNGGDEVDDPGADRHASA